MEKEKKYCVYSITDLRNDEIIYIGKTCNFKQRKYQHFGHNETLIDKHMFKEGRENFEMSIILDDIETNDEAVIIEDIYIVECQPLMNIRRSGNIKKDDPNKYSREYEKSDKRKDYRKEYYNSDKWREYHKEYNKSDKWRDYYRDYRKTDKGREYMRDYMREYRLKKAEKQKELEK